MSDYLLAGILIGYLVVVLIVFEFFNIKCKNVKDDKKEAVLIFMSFFWPISIIIKLFENN